ncbi:MAG: hypothetical protein V7609_1462 [Verrucomicrobiota bacterium]
MAKNAGTIIINLIKHQAKIPLVCTCGAERRTKMAICTVVIEGNGKWLRIRFENAGVIAKVGDHALK